MAMRLVAFCCLLAVVGCSPEAVAEADFNRDPPHADLRPPLPSRLARRMLPLA